MNDKSVLCPTTCAICGTYDNTEELYTANFSIEDLNPEIFSARRVPDKIHYRIVRCKKCGLIRSDPTISLEAMATLYSKSKQTYDAELSNLMNSYSRYLRRVFPYIQNKGSILEIGCGSGFFLDQALKLGFERVIGIEPSQQAVEKSPPNIKSNIICDIMRPGLLKRNQIDVICMFQTFDHISDPGTLLQECFDALKPGGVFLCLNHDAASMSARILGESSPIFDIEHTYLYSQDTIKQIFRKYGYAIKEVGEAVNTYSLHYLLQLLPFPHSLKKALLSSSRNGWLGKVNMTVSLGNLYLIAQKPALSGA